MYTHEIVCMCASVGMHVELLLMFISVCMCISVYFNHPCSVFKLNEKYNVVTGN